jgi:glycosyltransferase involved in cell wall biosynthesis
MKILLWHVHGSWTTAFVQGPHDYVVPVLPDRGPDGVGRAQTWDWPNSVSELPPDELHNQPFDVVVLQRPQELDLVRRWTGRRPGIDLPAVYLEHNTPEASPCQQRHPLAYRRDIPIAHVTHFNRLYWDNGVAPTTVIEHGIIDPGYRYTGELDRGAVVVNEPGRRGRIVGADLITGFADVGPVDVYGMQTQAFVDALRTDTLPTDALVAHQNLRTQEDMHAELARRRAYLHPMRWTSLGLSLIEAMQLGLPIVAVAATEAVEAVPAAAGVVSTDPQRLHAAFRTFLHEPDAARAAGIAARAAALDRYGLARFLRDWNELLARTGDQELELTG